MFGLIRSYSGDPLPLAGTDFGSNVLLGGGLRRAVVPVHVPRRGHRAAGDRRAQPDRGVAEPRRGWFTLLWRVIFPNLRVSLLSGAFLTLAIVVGEFTIATFLARPAFGPYISLIGGNKAYEPAAVSLISFGLTWIAMGLLTLVGRSSRDKVQLAGAH